MFILFIFLSEDSEVVTTVQKVSNIVSHKDPLCSIFGLLGSNHPIHFMQ